jgi:putative two-component system response regulator
MVLIGNESRILVVDDEPLNLKLMEALLTSAKYSVVKSSSGQDALKAVSRSQFDLIILDVMMPGMDGFDVCRRLKAAENTRMLPVILLTALNDTESRLKGIEAGADDFVSKPPDRLELLARVKSLVKIRKLNKNLTNIESVLFSLANTIEAKDPYTQGHISRVSNIAVSLGRSLGLTSEDIVALRYGGILHDIGKIGVSSEILNKPGPLTDKEWAIMRDHPTIGFNICKPLQNSLGRALDIIRFHHEKLDGSGYPDGRKGNVIPMVARIMAVADIFDALTSDRPYRRGMTKEKALDIIGKETNEGKLDATVVRHLTRLIGQGSAEQQVPKAIETDVKPIPSRHVFPTEG